MLVNITFKQVTALLVSCPSLVPHPTATNIREFVIKLVTVLSLIPSHQSAAYSYTRIFEQHETYALTGEPKWYNFGDPSPLQLSTDGSLGTAQQADTKTIYNVNHAYKDTANNIRRAFNAVLNRVVSNT